MILYLPFREVQSKPGRREAIARRAKFPASNNLVYNTEDLLKYDAGT